MPAVAAPPVSNLKWGDSRGLQQTCERRDWQIRDPAWRKRESKRPRLAKKQRNWRNSEFCWRKKNYSSLAATCSNRQLSQKDICNRSCLWQLAHGIWLFLGAYVPAQCEYFVSCACPSCPFWGFFFMDHSDFYLNFTWVLFTHIFASSWAFMPLLHCLRCQARAILVQIHCQFAGGTGAAGLSPRALPSQPETGFNAYHTFAI